MWTSPTVVFRSAHTPFAHALCRWAEKISWDDHRRERLEERADGSGGVKQREESDEEANGDDIMDMNIFLRDVSATKGIHCRLGMDGVRELSGGRLSCGVVLLSLFFTAMRGCHAVMLVMLVCHGIRYQARLR